VLAQCRDFFLEKNRVRIDLATETDETESKIEPQRC